MTLEQQFQKIRRISGLALNIAFMMLFVASVAVIAGQIKIAICVLLVINYPVVCMLYCVHEMDKNIQVRQDNFRKKYDF